MHYPFLPRQNWLTWAPQICQFISRVTHYSFLYKISALIFNFHIWNNYYEVTTGMFSPVKNPMSENITLYFLSPMTLKGNPMVNTWNKVIIQLFCPNSNNFPCLKAPEFMRIWTTSEIIIPLFHLSPLGNT